MKNYDYKDTKIDNIIDGCIIELFEEFKRNPESFKEEKILTYKFYDIFITKDYEDYKFRWEYPTKVHYRGDIPDDMARKHKSIDLCFIKEDSSDSVPYALEFKLKLNKVDTKSNEDNEFTPSNFKDIDPDFDELCYPKNKINTGYVIFFAFGRIINNLRREKAHNKNKIKFFDKYEELKNKISPIQRIKVIFVCVDNINGKYTYSIKHNMNNGFPEALNKEYIIL
ncbi:MAG: hypothetical protein PHU34_00535 [Candidatus Methanoperedens sp.]|nr:hypothetical protein [Candidatus Methanoperedens sp.]